MKLFVASFYILYVDFCKYNREGMVHGRHHQQSVGKEKKNYERSHFQVSRDLGRELHEETLQLIENY